MPSVKLSDGSVYRSLVMPHTRRQLATKQASISADEVRNLMVELLAALDIELDVPTFSAEGWPAEIKQFVETVRGVRKPSARGDGNQPSKNGGGNSIDALLSSPATAMLSRRVPAIGELVGHLRTLHANLGQLKRERSDKAIERHLATRGVRPRWTKAHHLADPASQPVKTDCSLSTATRFCAGVKVAANLACPKCASRGVRRTLSRRGNTLVGSMATCLVCPGCGHKQDD